MLGTQDFPVFLLAAITLNLMPGPDTIYILARSIAQGCKAGIASVLGISSGSLLHATAAAGGLSALLASSAFAFLVIKWLGAAYFIYLGSRLLFHKSVRKRLSTIPAEAPIGQIYRQGLLTNLLNPKVALFFLALLPQFVDPGVAQPAWPLLFLGAVFVGTSTLWCLALVFAATPISRMLHRTEASHVLADRVTGGIFVGLGLRLATERAV